MRSLAKKLMTLNQAFNWYIRTRQTPRRRHHSARRQSVRRLKLPEKKRSRRERDGVMRSCSASLMNCTVSCIEIRALLAKSCESWKSRFRRITKSVPDHANPWHSNASSLFARFRAEDYAWRMVAVQVLRTAGTSQRVTRLIGNRSMGWSDSKRV